MEGGKERESENGEGRREKREGRRREGEKERIEKEGPLRHHKICVLTPCPDGTGTS